MPLHTHIVSKILVEFILDFDDLHRLQTDSSSLRVFHKPDRPGQTGILRFVQSVYLTGFNSTLKASAADIDASSLPLQANEWLVSPRMWNKKIVNRIDGAHINIWHIGNGKWRTFLCINNCSSSSQDSVSGPNQWLGYFSGQSFSPPFLSSVFEKVDTLNVLCNNGLISMFRFQYPNGHIKFFCIP